MTLELTDSPAPPQVHDLKLQYPHFDDVESGVCTSQVRFNDRNFRVGDTLLLREWRRDWNLYTGRECYRIVTHALRLDALGAPHLVALSLRSP